MQHDVGGEVAAEFGQPYPHLGKGLGIGDAVAEDAGVRAAVVQARDGAEAFLAGCWEGGGGVLLAGVSSRMNAEWEL